MHTAVAAAVVAVMLAVPVMAAEQKAETEKAGRPGGVVVEAVSFTATVDSIDSKTRTITLKGSDGTKTSFIAGDEVRNFAQIKKGDIVTYDLVETVALDVRKATEEPQMVETESVKRAKLGEKPSGSIETVGFMTVRVEEIDYKTRKVAIKAPNGKIVHFTAGDQVKRLNEVKKGDEVVVQYMQKLSIKVTSPSAK
jgi:ribosomal 50S subunit-recycling heat shock protein